MSISNQPAAQGTPAQEVVATHTPPAHPVNVPAETVGTQQAENTQAFHGAHGHPPQNVAMNHVNIILGHAPHVSDEPLRQSLYGRAFGN
ncbi:hypothetical protein OPQ81_003916 [Rhizoctonia solani]|nr:hypothetical protein OPQ81_003916 [Rhizoctonia solani]